MTQTALEKENAALRAQLAEAITRGDDAIDIAVDLSVKADQAQSLATAAAAHIVGMKPTPPAAPAPPPTPALPPPPPRPASASAYYALSSHERKRVLEHFGEKIEEELHAELMHANTLRNARGGATRDDRRLTGQIVQDRDVKPAPFDPAPYYVGAPPARVFPDVKPMTSAEFAQAQADAMNGRSTFLPTR